MAEITTLDQKGIDFLIEQEGLVLHPYLDAVGIPTIGIGCTYYEDGTKVKMSDPAIPRERAISLFKTLVKTYELGVYSVTRDDITQNNFNALVSFTYNEGVGAFKTSTLLKKVNANPLDPAIAVEFSKWTRAGGKTNSDLAARRKRESTLYFTK